MSSTYTQNIDINQLIEQAQSTGTITIAGVAVALSLILTLAAIFGVLWLFAAIGRWKTVKKLGGHGWSQIIPVYRDWALSRVAGCNTGLCVAITALSAVSLFKYAFDAQWWETLTGACSIALIVVTCVMIDKICKRFGKKGAGFQIGLFFLPFVFYMILGCGSAQPVDQDAEK